MSRTEIKANKHQHTSLTSGVVVSKIFHDAAFLRSSWVSFFDEVRCSESGINTQLFDPPSSKTTKSLYKDDSNSLLSFAGPFNFFFPVPSAEVGK